MTGEELMGLLKGHEKDEVMVHIAKRQSHIDYDAIAHGNFGDGYVVCEPSIEMEHNKILIEPGTLLGYPLT